MTPALKAALALHLPAVLPSGQAWDSDAERQSALRALNRIRTSILDDDWPKKVFAFHRLYNLPVGDKGEIRQLDSRRRTLRRRLLDEEVNETIHADDENDLIETIDGLLDTIYVAIGWLIELGMTPEQINLAMQEVHASNLTKVDSSGRPIYDEGGKVLKGANYVRADLRAALDLGPDKQMEPDNGENSNSL